MRNIRRRGGLLLVLLVACLFDNCGRAEAEQNIPPNIVLIYADDLGWGDLGCQNPDSKITTPHLDRLAREGMRFTDAHSSSAICSPSRYAMLMGRYHWRRLHGIVDSFGPPVLESERTTLAELLRENGYRTACIGKWHLGWDWKAIEREGFVKTDSKNGFPPHAFDWNLPIPGGPCDHGFDDYFGDDVPNFPPYAWIEDNRILTIPTESLRTTQKTAEGNFETRPGPSVADWDFYAVMPRLTDRAVEWIGQQTEDQPFFLYFPLTSPHAPMVPAAEFAGSSAAGGFGDFVAQTDAAVGRVLAALEAGGHTERTVVIFTADNGPEAYAYPRIQNFAHRSMGPLRGVKRDLWEGGHRVPTIIRWPGHVPAGAVSSGLLSQIDFYATLAAIVGVEIPSGNAEDSCDQSALWTGTGPSARTEIVHASHTKKYAIRRGPWVLIRASSGGVSQVPAWFDEAHGYRQHDKPGELYNLDDDLPQHRNLYGDKPALVKELSDLLDSLLAGQQATK